MSQSVRIPAAALGTALVVVVLAGAVVLGATVFSRSWAGYGPGMMGGNGAMRGPGMMGWGYGPGMMGGSWSGGEGVQPGQTGFVPGTPAAPRVIHVLAGPANAFRPSTISIQRGETVTFVVTTMGPLVHEFMVGPADAVAADRDGTPEIAGIGMMETKSLTYTFDGSGPYAFACHATGHYEAGMRGTIEVVG